MSDEKRDIYWNQLKTLKERIGKALALTDTGSAEFHKAFGADGPVPGWRVVEKIREVLLGDSP